MNWDKLKYGLIVKHSDFDPTTYSINLFFIKITYVPLRKIYYSYKFRNYIHIHFINIEPVINYIHRINPTHMKTYILYKSPLSIITYCILFTVLASILYFNNIDPIKELSEIGGYGVREYDSLHPTSKIDNILDRDEKEKDNLLGIKTKTNHGTKDRVTYQVKPGDTLSEISQRFKISAESIAGSTNIRTLDTIKVGQILKIPAKEGFYYKIKKNDRIVSLAAKYSIPLRAIFNENPHINSDFIEEGEEIFLLGATPKNLIRGWLLPVVSRIVTSGYGRRTWPRRAFHKGLDMRSYYSPVRATKRGIVTFSGTLGGYGKVVVIKHLGGYKSLYAHLSRIYTRTGRRVLQGTIIGRSGNTGYSFGPHLHFELSHNGRHINPGKVLRGLRYK